MQTPINSFKQALADKRAQIGLWLGLAGSYSTEICAGAGFDWLLIDGEHAPNDLQSILQQAQIIAGYPGSHAIARVPMGLGQVGQMLIKQYLDLGIQTLLVPMIDTAEQAATVVSSARYPQNDGQGGVRGMGGARLALGAIPAVRQRGQRAGVRAGAGRNPHRHQQPRCHHRHRRRGRRVHRPGRPVGVVWPCGQPGPPRYAEADRRHHPPHRGGRQGRGHPRHRREAGQALLDIGATFVAVGLDNLLLARGARQLAAAYKGGAVAPDRSGKPY